MLTDELTTLITIEEVGQLSKRVTSYSREISYNRINHICDVLVNRGHLVENSLEGYQLTSKGKDAILREAIGLVACEDEARVKYRIERLEQLFDEISQQVNTFISRQQGVSLNEECNTVLQV